MSSIKYFIMKFLEILHIVQKLQIVNLIVKFYNELKKSTSSPNHPDTLLKALGPQPSLGRRRQGRRQHIALIMIVKMMMIINLGLLFAAFFTASNR